MLDAPDVSCVGLDRDAAQDDAIEPEDIDRDLDRI